MLDMSFDNYWNNFFVIQRLENRFNWPQAITNSIIYWYKATQRDHDNQIICIMLYSHHCRRRTVVFKDYNFLLGLFWKEKINITRQINLGVSNVKHLRISFNEQFFPRLLDLTQSFNFAKEINTKIKQKNFNNLNLSYVF